MIKIILGFLIITGSFCSYSPPDAYKFMKMASASYELPDSINSWTCSSCTFPLLSPSVF